MNNNVVLVLQAYTGEMWFCQCSTSNTQEQEVIRSAERGPSWGIKGQTAISHVFVWIRKTWMPTADWSILAKPRRQTFINPPLCLLQQRQEPSDWVPYILDDLWKENIINAVSFPHNGWMDDEGTKKLYFDIPTQCWEMVWKPFHVVWMYFLSLYYLKRVCALKRF